MTAIIFTSKGKLLETLNLHKKKEQLPAYIINRGRLFERTSDKPPTYDERSLMVIE